MPGARASVRDGAAAKAERRKKIFVIAGGALLLALLAFQIPRTLNRLHTSSAAAPPVTTTMPTTTPGATGTGSTASPVSPAQRRALRHFKVHDPFAPAVKGVDGGGALPSTGSSAPAGGSAPKGSAATSAPGGSPAKPAATTTPVLPTGPIGFTTPPVRVAPPAAAMIFVNGAQQAVGLKQLFPTKAPAFRLVAIDRKTVKIKVAGGTFTGGRAVITLERGRAVTLVNTTTGVRYVIRFAAPLAALPVQSTPAQPTATSTDKSKTSDQSKSQSKSK